jgi:hypothetical protein
MYLVGSQNNASGPVLLNVLDSKQWSQLLTGLATVVPNQVYGAEANPEAWDSIAAKSMSQTVAYIAPRGVGSTEWSRDERKRTHIRRRFMQLGQTAAGMQTYDIVRAATALQSFLKSPDLTFSLEAENEAATWALFASLFIDNVDSLTLTNLAPRNRDAPDFLNISRLVEPPHLVLMSAGRNRTLRIRNDELWHQQWKAVLADNPLANTAIQLVATPKTSD